MRSRPARFTLSALAWIALGAAAFFTLQQQQSIDSRRAALRAFETTARDAADALDDLQASQQAYVAAGQDPADWIPKVATYMQTASGSIDTLRSTAASSGAGPSLLDASTSMTQVGNIDRAIRQQLDSGETTSAAEAVFGEAADAISSAVSNVDAARTAERQAADAFEADRRRLQAYALGGAAAFVAILLAILGLAAPAASGSADATARETAASADGEIGMLGGIGHVAPTAAAPRSAAPASMSQNAVSALAGICTELGRAREAGQLQPLIEQAAALMNARGLIIWLGSTSGADLRPVLAHGYSAAALSRIPTVPRSADNAAAAAYRTGDLQIVESLPGGGQGAIVAPLLSADACIGALTAEIRDGGERTASTRAVAQIVAAQLASVLAAAAESAAEAAPETHTATA